MVAEALNGTQQTRFYSDSEMRDAVRAYQLAHSLDDATAASRIGISVGAFERWMDGTPAYTVARARLNRFCRERGLVPEPSEITRPHRSVIAYMAKQEPDEPGKTEASAPDLETAITESINEHHDVLVALAASDEPNAIAEEANTIEGLFVEGPVDTANAIIKHSPFPDGFALVWNAPPLSEPAIRIADGGVLLNKALRQLMGDPERVLIGVWSDPQWTTARIAVSPHVPEQLAKMALPIPKNGELSKRFRDNLAGNQVPNGTYALLPEGDCWITGEIALNPVDPQGALA